MSCSWFPPRTEDRSPVVWGGWGCAFLSGSHRKAHHLACPDIISALAIPTQRDHIISEWICQRDWEFVSRLFPEWAGRFHGVSFNPSDITILLKYRHGLLLWVPCMPLPIYDNERKKDVVRASAFALLSVNSAKQSMHGILLRVVTLTMIHVFVTFTIFKPKKWK